MVGGVGMNDEGFVSISHAAVGETWGDLLPERGPWPGCRALV